MTAMHPESPPYAPALIKLLQGVVHYDDESTWSQIRDHEQAIRSYFRTIGVELHLSEADGYAFLRQDAFADDDDVPPLPRLVRRVPLNYMTTLLCVHLRELLLQHDTGDIDSPRLVVHRADLVEAVLPYFRERSDETKIVNRLNAAVNRIVEMGFLARMTTDDDTFEVRRVLKAHLTADKLAKIKQSLEMHGEGMRDAEA